MCTRTHTHTLTTSFLEQFSLCLWDIVPVALGKYIQLITAAIRNAEAHGASCDTNSLEQLLEKMFTVFMDHANMWSEISTIPEVNDPELSESSLYG